MGRYGIGTKARKCGTKKSLNRIQNVVMCIITYVPRSLRVRDRQGRDRCEEAKDGVCL